MITQKQIDQLADGQQLEANGLRARNRAGVITYDFRFKVAGVRKQVSLGRGLSLKQAITKADMLRGQTSLGTDVAAKAQEDKARAANTLNNVLDAFIAAKGSDLACLPNMISAFNCHIRPQFGSRSIYDLNRFELNSYFGELAERIPGTARHAHKFLKWAIEWQQLRDERLANMNVVPSSKVLQAEVKRERVLTDDEIRDVWECAPAAGTAFGALIRLLLLTGCRRSEIAELQADEIKADRITIGKERMKAGKAHDVPLLPIIRELVGYLRPLSGWTHWKERLDAAIAARRAAEGRAPMPAWVLHDLRRTMRTRLIRLGTPIDVAEACLAHTLPGIIGVYDHDDRWEPRCVALARWADALQAIVAGQASGSNVVALAAPAA